MVREEESKSGGLNLNEETRPLTRRGGSGRDNGEGKKGSGSLPRAGDANGEGRCQRMLEEGEANRIEED